MDQNKSGKFIAKLRKEKNMTQEQLAEKMGVSINAVSKWERGLSFPDDDVSFCQKLLDQEGVALTPGSAFRCPGHVRLAYTKDMSALMEAAARMKHFVEKNYSNSSGVSC